MKRLAEAIYRAQLERDMQRPDAVQFDTVVVTGTGYDELLMSEDARYVLDPRTHWRGYSIVVADAAAPIGLPDTHFDARWL